MDSVIRNMPSSHRHLRPRLSWSQVLIMQSDDVPARGALISFRSMPTYPGDQDRSDV